MRIGFGPAAIYSTLPPSLSGFVMILPDVPSRLQAGADRCRAGGCRTDLCTGAAYPARGDGPRRCRQSGHDLYPWRNIGMLQRFVFAIGACLAGLAGMMLGPLTSVESGMGEPLLILSLVVIIIGGVGSFRGRYRRHHGRAGRYDRACVAAAFSAAIHGSGNS